MKRCVLAVILAGASLCLAQEMSSQPLRNTDFESPVIADGSALLSRPEAWSCFASAPGEVIGVTTQAWRSGSQSLLFRPLAGKNAFQGAAQEFAVASGYRYGFVVHVMNDPANRITGNAYGQIHFEWRDGEGREVGRTYGPTWGADLSAKRWERLFVEAWAPSNATRGVAVIMYYTKDYGGRGAFFVDDCSFDGLPSRAASPGPADHARRPTRP